MSYTVLANPSHVPWSLRAHFPSEPCYPFLSTHSELTGWSSNALFRGMALKVSSACCCCWCCWCRRWRRSSVMKLKGCEKVGMCLAGPSAPVEGGWGASRTCWLQAVGCKCAVVRGILHMHLKINA